MTTVTAFGYSVPFVVILVFVALVLGLALAVSFYLTIGWSVYRSVGDTRRERVRDDLRAGMLDRLFDPDAEWEPWVAERSALERDVLESLLDEYLRELDGSEAERLRELGDALGIPQRAGVRLETGDEYERLQALTWLTLLERPEPYFEAAFVPRSSRERAATARLLHESDAFEHPGAGVALLLAEADEPFSVFGQDTLYQIAREDPTALLETAAENHQSWSQPLLVQVLSVCQHLGTSAHTQDISWVTLALEHETEAVRVAAAHALGSFGWREELRDNVFLERATADSSPRVRGAVYEMLAAWGDEEALTILLYALVTEDDPRALVRGTNALVTHRERVDEDVPAVFGDAWAWSLEHADYDRIARGRPTQVRG